MKKKKKQQKIKINHRSWDDLKNDKDQKSIYKENACFVAEVNLSYEKRK
ncbi:MAG: hypothetical protein KAQ87_02825 [Candidatus Pacebacteria bacterium]|nr:hypothetical protein [Candidatus Paceibacterota bacterium]